MDKQGFLNHMKFTCLHQVEVKNPHTGELILVPCGSCPACLMRKSYTNEIKAKVASSRSEFCYFCSLSYDVFNCPSYKIEPVFRPDGSVLCKCSDSGHRKRFLREHHPKTFKGFSLVDLEPFSFVCDRDYYERFVSQANLAIRKYSFDSRFDGEFGYLNRRDLQLFMKRFRRLIFEKVGYYVSFQTYFVGEYGIDHFRPHFHLLLFFNGAEVAENIGQAIIRAWPFGRVDFSADRGKSADYVASYTNSYTFLPFHLRETASIRPFGRFSNHFGESSFESVVQQAKSGNFSQYFDGKVFFFSNKPVRVRPFPSLDASCFFNAAKYRGATFSSLLRLLYGAFRLFKLPVFKAHRVRRTVYSFCRFLSSSKEFISALVLDKRFGFSSIPDFRYLLNFIGYSPGCYISLLTDFGRRIFLSRLYSFFRSVELFLNGYGFSLFDLKFFEKSLYLPIINSISYYHEKSSRCYSHYCQNRNCYPDGLGYYFWRNSQENLREFRTSSYGLAVLSFQREQLLNRVKHRELNEKNLFFVSS